MKGNKSSTFSRATLEKARGLEPHEQEEGTEEDKLGLENPMDGEAW